MAWRGPLRPKARLYEVFLFWKPGAMTLPYVMVIDPPLEPRPGSTFVEIPHLIYDANDPPNSGLCLFDPEGGEWSAACLIAETTIHWTAEWLAYYELWHLTGEWLIAWREAIKAAMFLTTDNATAQAKLLLGPDRYLRIEPAEGESAIEMDDYDGAFACLPGLAAEHFDRKRAEISSFFGEKVLPRERHFSRK